MGEPATAERATGMVKHVVEKIVEDLGVLLDRPFECESLSAACSPNKVAGERQIHIAFKLGVTIDGQVRHGAMLIPLPDAITFACYLMMMQDDIVAQRRKERELDRTLKDAMVEVANLIGGSTDGALRDLYQKRVSARSEGCQGLPPGKAPGFERDPSTDIVIGRALFKLHTFPSFEVLLMLPLIA